MNKYRYIYDLKDGSKDRVRQLYKNGMGIVELLKTIESERLYSPHKKGLYRNVKDDFYTMEESRKDNVWRRECLNLFIKEVFFVGGFTPGKLWFHIRLGTVSEVEEFYIIPITDEIDFKRYKWDKPKVENLKDRYRGYYDLKEGAKQTARDLYKNGIGIIELLNSIESERLYVPNKKEMYRHIKEDFYTMEENKKDKIWRVHCLAFFLREVFFATGSIEYLTSCVWKNNRIGKLTENEECVTDLTYAIDKNRRKWDKPN